MIYLVCYDIRNPKRLQKTASILENFGIRVQYSFFQCDASRDIIDKMKRQVLSVIDTAEDYFFIYPLCEECTRKAVTDGTGHLIRLEAFDIV